MCLSNFRSLRLTVRLDAEPSRMPRNCHDHHTQNAECRVVSMLFIPGTSQLQNSWHNRWLPAQVTRG